MRYLDSDVINLSIGSTLSPSNTNLIEKAALSAIKNHHLSYTPIAGNAELRQAVIDLTNKSLENTTAVFNIQNTIITSGAMQSISHAFAATFIKGQTKVILPIPYWANYPKIIEHHGGAVIPLDTKLYDNTTFNVNVIAELLDNPQTVYWLIITSPGNPLGDCCTNQVIKEIGVLLRKYPNLYIMYDNVYEHLIYDKSLQHTNIFNNISPQYWDRIMLINSMSKGYSVTGLRIGYAVGSATLIKKMIHIQSVTSNAPSSIGQKIALNLLHSGEDIIMERKEVYYQNMLTAYNIISNIPYFTLETPPTAGMFLFPNINKLLQKTKKRKITSDTALCEHIMKNAKILIAPGSQFGAPGFLRIAFSACETKDLIQACNRIKKCIEELI